MATGENRYKNKIMSKEKNVLPHFAEYSTHYAFETDGKRYLVRLDDPLCVAIRTLVIERENLRFQVEVANIVGQKNDDNREEKDRIIENQKKLIAELKDKR